MVTVVMKIKEDDFLASWPATVS